MAAFSKIFMDLAHIGETLDGFGEIFDGFIGIAMLNIVTDAVLDVSLQDNLAAFVQS